MKRILFFLLLLPLFSLAQPCADEDTVRSNAVSLITYNSARINGSISHFSGVYVTLILKYVRAGQTDTTSASGVNPLRNLTGLQANTLYYYYYSTICGSSFNNQLGIYSFTTLQSTVIYTPMTAQGYQFKYLKADSGFIVPRLDTGLNKSPNIGGQIKFRPADSTFYGYNGEIWKPLAIDSSGIIALLNDKVDSVTVAGDSLWYWKQGVSYGYILPTQANEWKLLGNASTTAGTNFVGTTDAVNLQLRTNGAKRFTINTSGAFGLGTGEDYGTAGYVMQTNGSGAAPTWVNQGISLFDATVDFSVNADPNTVGTTFNPNTPQLTTKIYVSTINGSQWTWNGTIYVIYEPIAWGIFGNAGTTAGTNFVGTTDAIDFVIKAHGDEMATFGSVGRISLGQGNSSTNDFAITIGSNNTASGESSLSTGNLTTASGTTSTAMGESTTASGLTSMATGTASTASGVVSMVAGVGNKSKSYSGFVLGTYNDSTNATSATTFNALNRAFQIGIGTADAARANAMTVLFSGNVGIGTTTPADLLSLGLTGTTKGVLSLAGNTSGKITIQPAAAAGTWTGTLPTDDGDNGEVLSTNGSGVMDWIPMSGGGISGLTTNELVYGNSATTIASLPVATYPSLTELSYVKGVTSAIQTQMDTKLSTITVGTTTVTSGTDTYGLFQDGTVVGEDAGFTFNKTSNNMTVGSLTASNLTAGRIPIVTTAGLLTDNSHFAYVNDGINLLGTFSGSNAAITFATDGIGENSHWGIFNRSSGNGLAVYSYNTTKYLLHLAEDGRFGIGGNAYGEAGTLRGNAAGQVGIGIDPASTLQIAGSFAGGYVAKSATYTATISDYTIECTANTFTVTLPTSVGITGRIYNIVNSGAGVITIATTSSQTFVNVVATPTTLTLSAVGTYQVQSNGANWMVLSVN